MARQAALRATQIGIIANALLLLLKASASGLSESLTIFSETMNSLADVVAAIVILLCVRWAWKHPDEDHPFGHRRAEPVAGLVVAIFTGILGFEVVKAAVIDLWGGVLPRRIGAWPILALCATAVVKYWLMGFFQRRARQVHSPALRAAAIDCRNDVFIALQALVAVVLAELKVPALDAVAALLVGLYILYSAHRVGRENLDYLMGRAPDEALLAEIRRAVAGVAGVRGVVDVRGHYVGTFVHVELTAVVDGTLATASSHDIAEDVREQVEQIGPVDRAFVHIEPIELHQAGTLEPVRDERR